MDILLEGRQAAARRPRRTFGRTGGHFGSEPGAKLFDPAILDFGAAAAGIGRGMDRLGGRTPLPPPRGSRA